MLAGRIKHVMRDGKGFIESLEVFGSDLTVVNAARVSFNAESVSLVQKDVNLLNYLARHNHISPFFHPQVRFRISMPVFITREWFRHNVGLSRNEISRRYVDSAPHCWVPPSPADVRERDANIKQGSKHTPVMKADKAYDMMLKSVCDSAQTYMGLLELGVAPEVARSVLPQSMYTEFIETGSLYAYFRICKLRTDPTAQAEVREYAQHISQYLSLVFPNAWKALEGHQRGV